MRTLFFSFLSLNLFAQLPGNGVIDIDKNHYKSVIIGKQEWMVENLRTTRYSNGDLIPNVEDSVLWQELTSGAWANYNNDNSFENPYGKLYNWYTVSDTRNVCPTGWHVPSDKEWTALTDYLGGFNVAGIKMKSRNGWDERGNGTNQVGFTGLPSGYRNHKGQFIHMGKYAPWWSSTEDRKYDLPTAWRRELHFFNLNEPHGNVGKNTYIMTSGLPLRCVKNK